MKGKIFGVEVLIIISILAVVVLNSQSVEAASEDELVLDFSFQEPVIVEVNFSNTTYHKVTMNETDVHGGTGVPLLPVKPLKILLPQKGILESINVTFTGYTSLGENYNVLIGNASIRKNESGQNESNESYFNSSLPYPTELFRNLGTYSFRGYSLLLLNLYPVHYIGDTGEIYYYENMTLTITTNNSGSVNPFFRNLTCDETSMKQIVDNYSMIFTYTSVPEPQGNSTIIKSGEKYDFVIITRENFVNAPKEGDGDWHTFQELVEWKNNDENPNKITTNITTVEDILNDGDYAWNGDWGDRNDWDEHDEFFDDTACRIRNFIKHASDSAYWGAKYFLLGGDNATESGVELVPVRNLWYSIQSKILYNGTTPSDLYYACLEGTFNGNKDEVWGYIWDGADSGDDIEPRYDWHPGWGNYYAEADSCYNDETYKVGLFTPAFDLSDLTEEEESNVKFRIIYHFTKKEGESAEVRVYAGGTQNPGDLKKNYPIENFQSQFGYTFDISEWEDNDKSEVYLEFFYNDGGMEGERSFDIDTIHFGIVGDATQETKFLNEKFETRWVENSDEELVPGTDWDQKTYDQNEGVWEQQHYQKDVNFLPLEYSVYVGRAPVGDAREVSNFVSKTLKYEDIDQIPINDPFLEKSLFVGGRLKYAPGVSDDFHWGGAYCDHIKDILDDNNEFENRETLYDRDTEPIPFWTKEKLIDSINKGEFHIIYEDNHGLTNKLIRHLWEINALLPPYEKGPFFLFFAYLGIDIRLFIPDLPPISRLRCCDVLKYICNKKPFLLVANSCDVGAFDNFYEARYAGLLPAGIYHKDDCLGEYLTVKTEYGAFAVILNARYGWFNPKFIGGCTFLTIEEFFKKLCENDNFRLGQILHETKRSFLPQVWNEKREDRPIRYAICTQNLLGDPTVTIRRLVSKNNNPSTPSELDYETSSKVGNLYKYTCSASSTDPEGDRVSYKWKWDDHECLFWTRYYDSGDTGSKILWLPSGTHNISVKSRDIFLNESEWSDNLTVTVSFNLNMNIVSSPVVLGTETQFYGQALQGAAEPVSTWNYTLGDGNYSEQQNTNHAYGSVGIYNVTLTVTDNQSITSNVTKIVKVVILKSDINSSSDHGDPNESISFNDLSGGYYNISSWHWDFGDGNTSNNRNTSHAYTGEGVYNVSLNITDAESNYNVSYQTIYIDAGDPEVTSHSSDLDEVGYGYNLTITTNLSDSVSGIKTAAVNVTYPDDTYGNFTMNNTNGNTYEYTFNDTCQLGGYSYKIWVVDNAENLDSSSSKSFTVLRSFGYRMTGNSNRSIWDTVTGSKFKVNLKGVADNVSVYIDPGNATSDSHYQCMIYRHNDSKLMGISEEKNVSSGKGWQLFDFSVPKPVLMNDTEYILSCWADNYSVKMYYDNGTGNETFYDDGTSTLQGHYFKGVYNYTPDLIYFNHDDRKYSIYCRYTPDNTPPEITNISDTPGIVGFGFNVNITADVTDDASGVDCVKVNITYPDNSTDNFTIYFKENNTYRCVVTDTWLVGQHDYTIWAVDYAGNSNSSSGHSFTVSAQATLSVATLKNSYGGNEYINITDPPSPPDDYYLVGRGQTWNEYYNATSGRNILEIYTSPVNYQDESSSWTPIECNISLIDNSHPAYGYGYRAGNEHGLYHVYFKPNAQDSWPVAFAYDKSTDPETHVIRSKLLGVGYLDPSQGWAYEYLQSVQSSQGQIDGNSATYENVFTGTNVVWTYGNAGLKEEIIMSNTTKTVLQNHPPSEYGLSNQDSYLVFITKLDYHNLNLYNSSGMLTGNFTTSDGRIDFKDALGHFKCALPVGEAYELYDESVRHRLTYRILQYNSNYHLLSGLKVADLNDMDFPVVIDPSLTVGSSTDDGDMMKDDASYSTAQNSDEGLPRDKDPTFTIGQQKDTTGPPPARYFIWRGFVYFDTSSLPSNDLIDSVTLKLYKDGDFSATDFDIVVQNGQPTYPHAPLLFGDYDKSHYSGDGGPFNTASFSSGYNDITVTNFSWINTSGTTKLCLRSSRDINSNTPTGNEYVTVCSNDCPIEDRLPKLVIEYRNQSKINNTGSTDIKGYLYMRVQYYNQSALWAADYVAVDDTTPRTINGSEQLALDLIFNGLVNTNDLSHGDGTYRVYVAFRDPDGNILQTNDEKDMVSWYAFEVTY